MQKVTRYFSVLILFFIVLLSFFMHVSHFNEEIKGVHVWRQTQTQSTIINFYEEDMNILNPRRNDRGDTDGIFRMEFPLMQWLVACAYKLFGNHLWICRTFMFIIGIFAILGLYILLSALFENRTLSLIGAWAFTFSPSFFYYTINPLPDNMALCLSIWGMALFFIWYKNSRYQYLLLGGFLLCLGILCKLPFIIYYVVPFLYFLWIIIKKGIQRTTIAEIAGFFGFAVLPVLWYLTVIPQWKGNIIVRGMLGNDASLATLLDYYQHIFISTLPELLLNYGSVLFFLAGFYFLFKKMGHKDKRFSLMVTWGLAVIVYYLFEANAIRKNHDYYLFPFYPLLFILVAYGAYHLLNKNTILRYITIALLILLPFTCYLRTQGRWHPKKLVFNVDLLTFQQELRKAVPKDALVVAGNDESHCIMFYYIDKKGWGFDYDNLSAEKLSDMISKGAAYIYSDSRKIDENEEIMHFFNNLVIEKGSIHVYKLRRPDQ